MSSAHVEALENLLRSQGAVRDAEYKFALTRLSSEIRNRLAHGTASSIDFIEASVRALARIKGGAHVFLRMECLCDGAQFLYSNGRSRDALIAAAQFEDLARRAGDQEWLSKAQNLLGIVHADLGNVGHSVIHCAKALETAQKGDLTRHVSIINCIGIAMSYGGLYRQAISCFDRSLSISNTSEYLREAARVGPVGLEYARSALTNKAQNHYYLEEFEESFIAIDRCIRECGDPWDSLSAERRAIREFTYVFVALELGKLAAARQHAADCHKYSLMGTDRARFYSKVCTVLCEIHGGDSELGLSKLEALASCRGAADRIGILKFLIRSYDQLGRPDAALLKLEELAADLRAMQEAGLEAMLAIGTPIGGSIPSHGNELNTLAERAALLRVKVAERRLIHERVEMFDRLAIAADLKEDESGRHGYRVGKLAALLAQRLRLNPEKVGFLELAARLHDIGKIAMPDRILLSSQDLLAAERHFISTHTTVGGEILSKSDLPQLRMAEEIARHHHECWDGTGYPSKLAGKRIPIHARIVALADVFDALTHGRPYAPAWTIDMAIEEIRKRRGTQFDPDLTDSFIELIADLRNEHSDLDVFLAEASRNSPFLQAREKIRRMLEGERDAEKLAESVAETVH
jgi:putative two-component system response regulator